MPLTPPCNAFVALGAFETAWGDNADDVPADKSVVAAPDEGALDVPPLVDETASCAGEICGAAEKASNTNTVIVKSRCLIGRKARFEPRCEQLSSNRSAMVRSKLINFCAYHFGVSGSLSVFSAGFGFCQRQR